MTQGCYVTRLALKQNNLINGRAPIAAVIASESTAPTLRRRLEYIQSTLTYAANNGLNADGAYEFYVDVNAPAISYTVMAAERLRFESRTWWFPFVGRVPYLGFFDKADRDEMGSDLARQGYDVEFGTVGAFSSLGWFDDPIYSTMLRYDDGDLSQMLFHELTHRTLWLTGSVEFNENLAEFIGDTLNDRYTLERGGETRSQVQFDRRHDRDSFHTWLNNLKHDLELVYSNSKLSDAIKLAKKAEIIQLSVTAEKLPQWRTNLFAYVKIKTWNNAAILAASLYTPNTDRFQNAWACSKSASIGLFLKRLELEARAYSDPFDALDAFCS